MVEKQIISSDEVEISLTKILEYLIENWSVSAAQNFFGIYVSKINLLKQNPNLGKKSSKYSYIRSINITKHNRLFYRVDKNAIYLITLFDNRQHPSKNKFV